MRDLWLLRQCLRLPIDDETRRAALPMLLTRIAGDRCANDNAAALCLLRACDVTERSTRDAALARLQAFAAGRWSVYVAPTTRAIAGLSSAVCRSHATRLFRGDTCCGQLFAQDRAHSFE